MSYLTLVPAYGRDYKSAKAVRADWNAGKDFIIASTCSLVDGRYINKDQHPAGTTINIRYKQLTQICVIAPPRKPTSR